MKIPTFTDWVEEYFITEVSPTTIKDNFETRFDNWISELQWDDYVELADKYGKAVVEGTRI
jgi:hypothetical protein